MHTSHMRRLKHLSNLGLANELQTGVWEIDPDIERKLKGLGARNDIIATMHRAMREAKIDRPAGSFAIFDSETSTRPAIGRVATVGLTDEINDRHFVVVDGIDGKVHYADIGRIRPEALPGKGMIVLLEATEQDAGNRQQARLRILSYLNLEKLVTTEGATWLDHELTSKSPALVNNQGFGTNVKVALRSRLQWLTERGMVEQTPVGGTRPTASAIKALTRNEMKQVIANHSAASGLQAAQLMDGERFEGTYIRPISLASGKYAVFENSNEFTLVPWLQVSRTSGASLSPEKSLAQQSHGNWQGARRVWVSETNKRQHQLRSRGRRSLPPRSAAAGRNCASTQCRRRTTKPTSAQSFALLRPEVQSASISGPLRRSCRPPRSLG